LIGCLVAWLLGSLVALRCVALRCVPAWSELGAVGDSVWLVSPLALRAIPSLTSPDRVPHRPWLVAAWRLGQMLPPIF